jgi:SAM-dependent methyltransferase
MAVLHSIPASGKAATQVRSRPNISATVVAMYAEGPEQPNWYLDPLVAAQKRDVHLAWIARNVAPGSWIPAVLKTDLFEEAYGRDELLFSLPFDAGIKIGMDVSAPTVIQAADRRSGRGCQWINADVRRVPLADECVDLVLSNSTLDHFETEREIEHSLHELVRVLKPGGILLVTLDNPRNPLFFLLHGATKWTGISFQFGKTLPLQKLLRILERAGLEVESTDALIHNPRFVSTLIFLALRRVLGRRADTPIAWLLSAFSKLGRLPTRGLTAAFVAACARKPGGDTASSSESRVSGNMKFSPQTCSVSKQPVNRMESAW